LGDKHRDKHAAVTARVAQEAVLPPYIPARPKTAVPGVCFMALPEFNGLAAGQIKRRPEVEVLLVTGDSRTEVVKKV
jgi:hypothetical protein